LGGYNMNCPIGEFRICRVRLETVDRNRLYLLGIDDFRPWTNGGTWKLADINDIADTDERTAAFFDLDLRLADNLEPVIVTVDIAAGPLIIIDGNHRAAAQHRRFGHLDGVAAYVCEHARINRWGFVPCGAR
jgi:hypothetical protein